MQIVWSWLKRVWTVMPGSRGRRAMIAVVVALLAALIMNGSGMRMAVAEDPVAEQERVQVRFPTIPVEHKHARALFENAMRYFAPESQTIDPNSGYLVEGWNHDPEKAFCLRSFTQLTAIGQWTEVLADIVAGYADTPYMTREEALARLAQVVASLRHDQKDPQVSAKGLLGNFLDMASGKRQGLLASDVEKAKFLDAFGLEKGDAIWEALKVKGWLVSKCDDCEASIHRDATYGWNFFDGALTPFGDDATKQKIMQILDHRVVMVVFGDNANLTTSVAKTIGSLLHPEIRDNPKVVELRGAMEQFLDDQEEGYRYLYNSHVGLFHFGWDATKDRLFGWADGQGNWQAGYMDYLVNEFRGPVKFVVLRYGFPANAIRNLGFKMKPYRMQGGREVYTLAPWEGSAFQALGLGLSMAELNDPSWRILLENVVDIEIDYATRKNLPGFLSESYIGEGAHYTGDVGIPEIAVTAMPRITDAASLYTLGVAYMVSPAKVEQFLADHWPVISTLLTDHGPWEGYNVAKQEPIKVQTSAHTLSLILGLIGTSSENMKRYLELKGLSSRLAEIYKPGEKFDFLSQENQVFAWTDKESVIKSVREKDAFCVKGDQAHQLGVAFVSPLADGVSLSGGMLSIRYRSTEPIDRAILAFKPTGNTPAEVGLIPKEVFTRFADTGGREEVLQIPLPAMPGLTGIKEVVITAVFGGQPVDLDITGFTFTPHTETPPAGAVTSATP